MPARDAAKTPEVRLAELRSAMQGAEVHVVLFAWMREVEEQLKGMRTVIEYASSTAERAASDSFGLRPLG